MAYDNTNTCAVWKRKTKTGKTYVSVMGTTASGENFNFNCFINNFKTEDKHPDFKTIKEDADQGKTQGQKVAPKRNDPIDESDIPF